MWDIDNKYYTASVRFDTEAISLHSEATGLKPGVPVILYLFTGTVCLRYRADGRRADRISLPTHYRRT